MRAETLLAIAVLVITPLLQGCPNPEAESEKRRKALGMPPFEEKK